VSFPKDSFEGSRELANPGSSGKLTKMDLVVVVIIVNM